jgi:hypothetical protein
MSVDHELATRTSVSVEVLGDFQHTNAPQVPDYWADAFVPSHTPRGRPIERGPMVTAIDETLTLVSAGEVVNVIGSHATRYWARPDVMWLPFRDLAPLSFGLVWRTETENDAIRALAQTVRDLGTLQL